MTDVSDLEDNSSATCSPPEQSHSKRRQGRDYQHNLQRSRLTRRHEAGWPFPDKPAGVRCVRTLAWDVGILVSSRNCNIPKITWSIIPIAKESKGHAKKKFWANPEEEKKKVWPLRPRRRLPSAISGPITEAPAPASFPALLPLEGHPGCHPQCWHNNFVLHLRLNDLLHYTSKTLKPKNWTDFFFKCNLKAPGAECCLKSRSLHWTNPDMNAHPTNLSSYQLQILTF